MSSKSLVFIPESRPGYGSGHVLRTLKLVETLVTHHPSVSITIYLSLEHPGLNLYPDLAKFCDEAIPEHPDLIVLDKPWPTRIEIQKYQRLAPVVGLDSGVPGRSESMFLIDILPGTAPRNKLLHHSPNWRSIALLDLPESTNRQRWPVKSILVSFGAEDPAGLGPELINSGILSRTFANTRIHYIPGHSIKPEHRLKLQKSVPGWVFIDQIPHLESQLKDFDLLITSYGLLCFESLAAGTPVLLMHPSKYHKELSQYSGIPNISSLLESENLKTQLEESVKRFQEQLLIEREGLPNTSLSELVHLLSKIKFDHCPACASHELKIIFRESKRSYLKCNRCATIFQILTQHEPKIYSKKYFMEEYLHQYGRTYLEDFESIKINSRSRLKKIKDLLGKKQTDAAPSLLDIGCAYGPFLAAAQEQGFVPTGMDVSEDAISYIKDTLKLNALVGDICQADPETLGQYDVVSLWYVIEHFPNLNDVLKRINLLVKPGGILAISTPSATGITGRRNLRRFLEQSPTDHFTIWSPRQAIGTLSMAGFRVKKIIPASFHPERYPRPVRYLILKPLLKLFNRLFNLGDTIEIYASKERTL